MGKQLSLSFNSPMEIMVVLINTFISVIFRERCDRKILTLRYAQGDRNEKLLKTAFLNTAKQELREKLHA